MLPLINGILSDSLQSLSACFTGIMKKEHLLVQKSRATKVIKGLEHSSADKRLREMRLPGMEKRSPMGDMINTYKHPKGGCNEDGATLLLVVPSASTRGNRQKLEPKRSTLSTRKHPTPVHAMEHQQKPPKGNAAPLPPQ